MDLWDDVENPKNDDRNDVRIDNAEFYSSLREIRESAETLASRISNLISDVKKANPQIDGKELETECEFEAEGNNKNE